MDARAKVFGIGFQKTATSSLAAALYILGYNVTGFFGAHDPDIGEKVYDMAYDLADRFDAAQDTPWPVLYRELDQKYPGSKFILTVRPVDRWINSVVKHFKNQYIPAHEWIYGVRTARGNEDAYIHRYEEHNREVQVYFADRPGDLLVMDITQGDGWEKLCPFVGQEIPLLDFPAQNGAAERSNQLMKRGINYLKRRLSLNNGAGQGSQLSQGVSATFVRDILHYHYTMYGNMWEGVQGLSPTQFIGLDCLEDSVCGYLMAQIFEERTWLNRLNGKADGLEQPMLPPDLQTKEAVYRLWEANRLAYREYGANLTDEISGSRLPGRNEYVWEVFVHLMNQGNDQRAQIRRILLDFAVPVKEKTFIEFFR
jgi:hypothetical protein